MMITTLSYLDITVTPWKGRPGRMLTRKLRLRELNRFPDVTQKVRNGAKTAAKA